jgi:hypothetical protein
MESAVDVLTLMRTQATVKIIKEMVFSKAQRLLLNHHRRYALVDVTTSSPSDAEVTSAKKIKEIVGQTVD